MKIKIFMEADRLTVASILVKNGYTVRQGKEKRTSTGKSYDYFLETLEDDNDGKGDKSSENKIHGTGRTTGKGKTEV